MNKILYVVIATLLAVVLVLSVGLACKREHNRGYNEGWQSCIEENNLYNRYERVKRVM